MKLYKFTNSTTSEIIDRTTEFSSKWIITTGMMWENINANYAEEYDSLLKVKNQVIILCHNLKFWLEKSGKPTYSDYLIIDLTSSVNYPFRG